MKVKENKDTVSVFIDFRNCHYYLEKHSWDINWEKFKYKDKLILMLAGD